MQYSTYNIILFNIIVILFNIAQANTAEDEFKKGYASFKQANYSRAYRSWVTAANKGNVSAQYSMGILYERGLAVPKDPKQAFFWYKKAADQGNPSAQFKLGVFYYLGIGIQQNFGEAAVWITSSAKQGYGMSQYGLGCLYYEGHGVPQNYQTALYWFRKAGKQKIVGALNNLGGMYAKGIGVTKNLVFAYAYFDLAVRAGDTKAQKYRINMQQRLSSSRLLDAQILADSWATGTHDLQ